MEGVSLGSMHAALTLYYDSSRATDRSVWAFKSRNHSLHLNFPSPPVPSPHLITPEQQNAVSHIHIVM